MVHLLTAFLLAGIFAGMWLRERRERIRLDTALRSIDDDAFGGALRAAGLLPDQPDTGRHHANQEVS